jgi:hypothetical protein
MRPRRATAEDDARRPPGSRPAGHYRGRSTGHSSLLGRRAGTGRQPGASPRDGWPQPRPEPDRSRPEPDRPRPGRRTADGGIRRGSPARTAGRAGPAGSRRRPGTASAGAPGTGPAPPWGWLSSRSAGARSGRARNPGRPISIRCRRRLCCRRASFAQCARESPEPGNKAANERDNQLAGQHAGAHFFPAGAARRRTSCWPGAPTETSPGPRRRSCGRRRAARGIGQDAVFARAAAESGRQQGTLGG